MKAVMLKSGQTFVEEELDDTFRLVPAHKWIEQQLAVQEIALGFDLLYENKNHPNFKECLSWLCGKFRDKYGEKFPELFDSYLNSPQIQSLIVEMQIDEILGDSGFDKN